MTRLEQLDAYRTEFEDRLEAVREREGAHWWRLGSSAFYPTGGGQLHDTGILVAAGDPAAGTHSAAGTLSAAGDPAAGTSWRVVDVVAEGEAVWHRVEPVDPSPREPAPGERVRGTIDWPRRFRHMQRHTAQHLLSQAFVRVDERFATRSVSLTGPDLTVDLDGEPGEAELAAAERLVNEVAARSLPIRAFEIEPDELDRHPLRRPPKVPGRLRIVEMGDWERSACGGTHLRSTAEALPVLVLGRERVRGGAVRVTFRAGLEAIELASATHRAAAQSAVQLSSRIDELPDRVSALLDAAAAARRSADAARSALADAVAEAALREAGPGDQVVQRTLRGDQAALADALADALAARGATAVVAADDGARVRLVFASGAGADVRPALQGALEALGGRGGGRPERAQGAADRPAQGALEQALARAVEHLGGGRPSQ